MTTTSSTSSSNGILTALGLGSGLDIDTLVSTLTESEMSAANNRLSREQTAVTTQVSAVASLKSALSVFQASLLAFKTSSSYSTRSVTSSKESLLTAKASASAAPGTYKVIVKELATAQQLVSTSFSGGKTTSVGYGQLTIGVGSSSFNVDIDSSKTTLANIRDAINNASGNSTVSASLIYGSDGSARLALTSNKAGAANTISVTTTGGDGGLDALTYGSGNTTHYTEEQEANDALISVAGEDHTSSSNTISDAIDGITLNLQAADENTTVSVTVANDADNMTTLVQDFVKAYNTMQSSIAALGSYDASTQTAGALLGDPLYNGITRQLSHALIDQVSGINSIYKSLSSLGVTTDASGQLSVDEEKLSSALSADFTSVSKVISGSNGLLARVSSMLDDALSSSGSIAARDTTLDNRQEAIDKQQDLIDLRTAKVQQRYLTKFNSMDTLLAKLQNTASYLTQQFDALNKDSG
ncbi:MAG: flagellar filament capping protein FliD [Steroidobacteraceae bacterium]